MSEQIVNRTNAPIQQGGMSPGYSNTQPGRLHGESVQIQPNAASLLEDAKEEVSLLFKERMEKTLARREMSTNKKDSRQQVLVAKIQELMEQVPDLYKNVKMKLFIERMASNFPATPQELMRHLGEFSSDPTLQFVALQVLEQEARVGGPDKESQLDVIQKATTDLMSSQGEAVRAGLNVSRTASEFAARLNTDTQELRDTYRDAVLDYGGITATYRALIARYGERGESAFETTRKFLMKALSADYNAQGTSIDRPRLKAIMDDMYALKLLGTVQEQCSTLMATMRDRYGQAQSRSGQELMGKVLDIKEQNWVQPSQISAIPSEMNVSGLANQIYFLREVDTVFREIPVKTYNDPADREQLLGASREVLEQLFNKEQEEES